MRQDPDDDLHVPLAAPGAKRRSLASRTSTTAECIRGLLTRVSALPVIVPAGCSKRIPDRLRHCRLPRRSGTSSLSHEHLQASFADSNLDLACSVNRIT